MKLKIINLKILQILCLLLIIYGAYSQSYIEQIKKLEANFLAHPDQYINYEKLSFLVSEHYLELNKEQRMQIRYFLSEHSRFSTIHINPLKEPGTPITIKGTVQDENGIALKNVRILVFHTDAHGYYAPDDSIKKTMNEPDCRLFGYMITDELGHFEFTTIHPGTYPNKYKDRYIPQHIHLEIDSPGFNRYSIQMAFEDDPAMKDPYWQDWAVKLKYPVIKFYDNNKFKTGVCDIRLNKK